MSTSAAISELGLTIERIRIQNLIEHVPPIAPESLRADLFAQCDELLQKPDNDFSVRDVNTLVLTAIQLAGGEQIIDGDRTERYTTLELTFPDNFQHPIYSPGRVKYVGLKWTRNIEDIDVVTERSELQVVEGNLAYERLTTEDSHYIKSWGEREPAGKKPPRYTVNVLNKRYVRSQMPDAIDTGIYLLVEDVVADAWNTWGHAGEEWIRENAVLSQGQTKNFYRRFIDVLGGRSDIISKLSYEDQAGSDS